MVEYCFLKFEKNKKGRFRRDLVYVDGACKGNHDNCNNKTAGVGIFFGKSDIRNKSIFLGTGSHLSGEFAELMAINHALTWIIELWPLFPDVKIQIQTDSKYCVDVFRERHLKWKRTEWKYDNGNPVKYQKLTRANLSLIETINDKYEEAGYGQIRFKWVKGHSGIYGNEKSDELANKAISANSTN